VRNAYEIVSGLPAGSHLLLEEEEEEEGGGGGGEEEEEEEDPITAWQEGAHLTCNLGAGCYSFHAREQHMDS
jgi:hypothetical protein